MSKRTRKSKSTVRHLFGNPPRDKSWKTTLPTYYVELPTQSRAGINYSKRVPAHTLLNQPPNPLVDMVSYLRKMFGGLF